MLHRVTDVRDSSAGPHAFDRFVERLLRDAQQRGGLLGYLSDRQCNRAVAVVPVERGADINRDDVALVQHSSAGRDPVDHLFVDRRTNRRRIPVIPLERRYGACPGDALLRQRVQVCRRHTRRDVCDQLGQDLADQAPRLAHALELGRRTADDHGCTPDGAAVPTPGSRVACAHTAAMAAARSAAT